jgi:hypothetical protein
MTKLAALIQETTLTISGGRAIKPTDFAYTLALRINNAKVFQVNPDMIWAVQEDVIDPAGADTDSYYYTEYQNYYSFLPANIAVQVTLDYVQTVPDIVWGYTLDGNGRQVYSAGLSTQPVWGQLTIVEITERALKGFGLSYRDMDLEQAGQTAIITGD